MIQKEKERMRFIRGAGPDLQVEAGTLWHGAEGGDGGHAGEGAHQDEDAPAMKLVRRAHLEAPAYQKNKQTTAESQRRGRRAAT